jgi:hypothetical protein
VVGLLLLVVRASAGGVHAAPTSTSPPAPVRVGPAAVLRELRRIDHTLQTSVYTHGAPHIDPRSGVYKANCSNFLSWVLARNAPRAQRAVVETAQEHAQSIGRPYDRVRAASYYHRIVSSPTDHPADGWQRVPRIEDLAAGDVIVWLRPPSEAKINHNTGHTLVATGRPVPDATIPNGYLVRVADVSSFQHEDDTRTRDGRTGYGHGTILLIADPATNAPVAFGRVGRHSPAILASGIALGRPVE